MTMVVTGDVREHAAADRPTTRSTRTGLRATRRREAHAHRRGSPALGGRGVPQVLVEPLQLCSMAARVAFGLLRPWPKPLWMTSLTAPLILQPLVQLERVGRGTRWSFSPCWMSVGALACLM